MHVLEELCEDPCRFNELRRRVPAAQKSLSATLRRVERNGIVHREVLDDRDRQHPSARVGGRGGDGCRSRAPRPLPVHGR
ncbi:winged helix-turn-helix transcriptional regulator [Terrabacter sp. NPDC000476]|uniref:winged helix-turn-helix transcriptional regulator n=1 Tax=Terrabacter sp. NPDC000476 TaxID=3154258 RepID=UPI00331C15C6